MPIDPSKALGAVISGGTARWDKDKVILYHLGVGAGTPQTDPNELTYTYEQNLKVLPSFGVIPAFAAMGGLGAVVGISFNPMMLLHGEQDLEIRKAIPVEAEVETSGKVAGLYDKGKAALVVIETETRVKGDSDPLFVNRFSLFLRRRFVHRDVRTTILRKDPSFLRVRLTNVDNEKVNASRVTPCELLERSNLGAERWSGIGAEDERHR